MVKELVKKKVLIWTWASPFMPSGSPQILRNLSSFFPTESVLYLFGKHEPNPVKDVVIANHSLPSWIDKSIYVVPSFLRIFFEIIVQTPLIIILGFIHARRFNPDFILTVYYRTEWILSSFLLAKLLNKPLYYYVHDPYLERYKFKSKLEMYIAGKIEEKTLTRSNNKVIVLYETLSEYYNNKYKIKSQVLPHIADSSEPHMRNGNKTVSDTLVIGFAGSIYANNMEQIKDLIKIVDDNSNYILKIWTNANSELIGVENMKNPDRVIIGFEADKKRLLSELSKCDLLYLPLDFHGSTALPIESLQYVLPTKAVDYLQTGSLILVHCPAYFETSVFFKKYNAAYILNSDNPEDLRVWLDDFVGGKIEKLKQENILSALKYFDKDKNLTKFEEILNGYVTKKG
jgi:hypothetical protein